MSGTIISFDDGSLPSLSQVGGKALSLARMTKVGFNVPVGFTLSTEFFADWISGIVGSREWEAVIKATPRELPGALGEVRRRFGEIPFTDIQLKALDKATRGLHPAKLFAVRSSSPEEDLESASFAGEYETLLGVTGEKLIEAISTCALSCFSERLILYKQKHGFDIRRPQIAVIVQRQVKSEKAGVAFSLNPINNCYDECVINANFGLGESVVSGGVTPDQFVVDKVGLRVVDRRLGTKAFSLEIEDQGLIQREKGDLDGAFCLSEDEIIELTEIVSQIEELYGRPVDVEWAFAGGEIFILQARPVTAYFPLPESMRTKPGEQKRVYLDGTLTKLGMNDPMSVMGGDLLEIFGREFLRHQTGLDLYRLNEGIYESACGRSYVNLSNILKLGGRRKLSAAFRSIDTIAASIVETLDEKEYRATSFPRAIVTPRIFKVLRLVPAFLLRLFGAMKDPAKAHARFKEETE
ncbi:MAG: PEP/pyruvate-binding domain-containing protein, partial [Verrucomicrobiia bacterium]